MTDLNPALIRERCTYVPPTYEAPPTATATYEWKFEDKFGNRYGRLYYRLATLDSGAPDPKWIDVFERDVHQSEFFSGSDFAVAAIADDECFMIFRVVPTERPTEIFRQKDKLEIHGLSADGKLILVQSTKNGNWYRPELLVMSLQGEVVARLSEFADVTGCWAGTWARSPGDQRLTFHHEASGYFRPAIWSPIENRIEEVHTDLEGEVFATWDRTGRFLILKRGLNGRSDLHRLDLTTRRMETLQPLDGVVFRHDVDPENRVVGMWSSNDRYAKSFRERERHPSKGFNPSLPLKPWRFRRIADVPCFVAGNSPAEGPTWTVFDGYGMPGYHHTDGYNWKVHGLVDHGFQVVMVNTRGCSGFGRVWREATLGNIGFAELEDMRRVRAALIGEGLVDCDRTIMAGDSWGGYMTLLAMGTQPELWNLGLAGLPVGDYESCHWEATPLIRAVNRTYFGGDAYAQAAVYHTASPLTYVDSIRAPIRMVVGKYDLLCPPKQNIAFAEALLAKNGKCELDLFEGAHGAPSREERIRQNEAMIEFLLRHCRAFDERAARC